MKSPSQSELQQALRDAGSAHHEYEVVTLNGVRDEHWPGFYAAYVLGRLGDFTTPSTLSQWLEEAPGRDNWAEAAAKYVLSKLIDK